MNRRILALVVLLTLPGCASNRPPATIVTAPGVAAYNADLVVQRLQELSNVVQADTGTLPGNIKPKDAFTIIEWISGDARATPPTTGVVQIVQATAGDGWKVGAKLSYTSRIRPLLLSYTPLTPYVAILDGVLGVL